MAEKPLEVYLNDHLAGATLGSDLAGQIAEHADGTPFAEPAKRLAAEIEADRQALVALMDALDISRNPVKQVAGWIAEKASRVKFSGAGSGEHDHGLFMAIETLRLGVAGKKCLWTSLARVREEHGPLADFDLEGLLERASGQEEILERERLAAGERALAAA